MVCLEMQKIDSDEYLQLHNWNFDPKSCIRSTRKVPQTFM